MGSRRNELNMHLEEGVLSYADGVVYMWREAEHCDGTLPIVVTLTYLAFGGVL